MSEAWHAFSAIIAGIIGIAILAVIVSNQSQTSNVLNAGGNAVSTLLHTALSPITGSAGATTGSLLQTPSLAGYIH